MFNSPEAGSCVGSKKYSDDGLGFRVQRARLVIEAKQNYFWKNVNTVVEINSFW